MTRISKCDALALSVSPEAPARMLEVARINNIPDMREQADAMVRSTITVHLTLLLAPVLAAASLCLTKPDSMGDYVLTTLAAANMALSAYALKRLYNTACYLQVALGRYPSLSARLLRTS